MPGSVFSAVGAACHRSWMVVKRAGESLVGDWSSAISDPTLPTKVICRLDLSSGPGTAIGTGFFLNVPGTTKDVLVTAGHNLIRPSDVPGDRPKRTDEICIRLYDSSGNPAPKVVRDYHIHPIYAESPGSHNAINDYGVILLDRDPANPREAFGFDIALAATDLQSEQSGEKLVAHVGGYPGSAFARNGRPAYWQSDGIFGEHNDRQVLYYAGTHKGMSGGPIWVNFGGQEIVVGIHNNRGAVKNKGNRGTRLELRAMQQICSWAGGDQTLLKRSIKVSDPTYSALIPRGGLYIQIGSSDPATADTAPLGHARSGFGRDPSMTTFDILPARAPPTHAAKNKPQFVLMHGRTTGSPRFLQVDTDPNATPRQITSVENLNSACFVQFEPPLLSGGPFKPFSITMLPNHDDKPAAEYKLVLAPEGIPPPENTFGLPLENLGVLIRPKLNRPSSSEFENFTLE